MTGDTLIGLALLLLVFSGVLSAPYLFYFDSQKVERPVVVFTCVGWKILASTLYTALLMAALGGFVVMAAHSPWPGIGAYIILLPAGVLLVRLAFVQTWLHVTYWHHEWGASLTIDRPAQTATYTKAGQTAHFLLADITRITRYESYRRRSYSRRRTVQQPFHYQIWELRDGTALVITCLLYSFTEPSVLVPAAPTVSGRLIKPRICWLPGDPLITFRYASIFYS